MSCPGCGHQVHPKASKCPACGYRAELGEYRDLLRSLATVSSILVGFGLTALVEFSTNMPQDASSESSQSLLWYAVGCWIFSSILLLMLLLAAELGLRKEIGDTEFVMAHAESSLFTGFCAELILFFLFAVVVMAAGIVLIGFHFSLLYGGLAVLGTVLGGIVIGKAWWSLRRREEDDE